MTTIRTDSGHSYTIRRSDREEREFFASFTLKELRAVIERERELLKSRGLYITELLRDGRAAEL